MDAWSEYVALIIPIYRAIEKSGFNCTALEFKFRLQLIALKSRLFMFDAECLALIPERQLKMTRKP